MAVVKKSERKNNGNVHPNRIFQNPQELWERWEEYKVERQEEAKQWPKVQYVGKNGERVEDYPVMPLIIDGFQIWHYNKYKQSIRQYIDNENGYYDDFMDTVARMKEESRFQNVTGGLLGVFNQSLTARLHGLVDRQEQDIKGGGIIKVTIKK